jgi:hypothetical protein
MRSTTGAGRAAAARRSRPELVQMRRGANLELMAIGPEKMNVPGPKLILSPQQAKSVSEQAKRCSHVEVEDSGAGYLKVRSFDREGEPIDERWIDSDGFDRLRSLLRHDEDVHRSYPPGD